MSPKERMAILLRKQVVAEELSNLNKRILQDISRSRALYNEFHKLLELDQEVAETLKLRYVDIHLFINLLDECVDQIIIHRGLIAC